MGGPATTNPWLIAIINMTIVFGVLAMIGVFINLIYMVDPTKKKPSEPAPLVLASATPVLEEVAQDDDAIIAVIAAAVAAYGYAPSQIVSIQPMPARSWTYTARQAAVSTRNQMF